MDKFKIDFVYNTLVIVFIFNISAITYLQLNFKSNPDILFTYINTYQTIESSQDISEITYYVSK